MSDGRLQSSRDDRRRDHRDGDRGHPRRRSRSPRGRDGHDIDRYQSSRGYRDRDDRYGGRDGRDRGYDRGGRRDPYDDRRRHDRRDRDLFDDRGGGRRGDRRDDRRDMDRGDRGRDRDDMRQLESQARGRSASPPRKPKEPTPDLTDITSVLTRKRRLTQWDIKPPGYENVSAESAKLSGMFPLPGAPRQPAVDPTRMKDMNQGSQVSTTALKPSTARQSKRLFVYNIPSSATDSSISDFFNLQLNGLNVTRGNDPCLSAQISTDHSYALLEFKNVEDATNAMALDGISMEPDAMETDDNANGTAQGLQIKRPKDYIVPAVTDETANENGVLSTSVPDTQNKISITHIPAYLPDENVQELLVAFGELKNFILVKDTSSEQSRGIAFCEYVDPSLTDVAVEGLNGLELGESKLKAQRASIGLQQVGGEMSVNAMSMMAGTTNKSVEQGRVLCLMNMITPEELMDPEEADGKFLIFFPCF